MEPFEQTRGPEERRDDPETGLEESMWSLELGGEDPPQRPAFPERPGQLNCAYYLRTGTCGFGDICRYNHPRDRETAMRAAKSEPSERRCRPACRYFIKHGTCHYGDACKFEHMERDGSVLLSSVNKYGYPLRPGEKECNYYIRTGHCKFGMTCKFNHPEAFGASLRLPSTSALSYSMVSPRPPSPQQYPVMSSWEAAKQSMLQPAPYMQGAYSPVLFLPGVMPDPGWNTFSAAASPLVSPDAQHTTTAQGGSHRGLAGQFPPLHPSPPPERTVVQGEAQRGLPAQFSPFHPTHNGSSHGESYPARASSAGPSTSSQTEHMLPERLDEPECQDYERAGYCKFGSKYK